jgi:hypothetical protein
MDDCGDSIPIYLRFPTRRENMPVLEAPRCTPQESDLPSGSTMTVLFRQRRTCQCNSSNRPSGNLLSVRVRFSLTHS